MNFPCIQKNKQKFQYKQALFEKINLVKIEFRKQYFSTSDRISLIENRT